MAVKFIKAQQSLITLPNGQYMCRNVNGATLTAWATPNDDPLSWTSQDIGTATVGSWTQTAVNPDAITQQGSGADIWTTTDGFRFTWVQSTGDCTITARVTSLQNTGASAKAGVMFRTSLAANSMFTHSVVKPTTTGNLEFDIRPTNGGTATNQASIPSPLATQPVWIQLTRQGDTYTSFYSLDGQNYIQMGTAQTIVMGSTIYVGLSTTSHADGTLCQAVFDNVTVTNAAAGAERWIIFISQGTDATKSRAGLSISPQGFWRAAGRRQDSEAGATTADDITQVVPGQTYFVAGRFNYLAGSVDLFINGALVSSTASTNWFQSSDDVEPFAAGIGCRGGGASGYFDGVIDDVRIYHRALTDQDIMNQYLQKGRDRSVGYVRWKLREGGTLQSARQDIKDTWQAQSDGATDTFIDTYPTYALPIVGTRPRTG